MHTMKASQYDPREVEKLRIRIRVLKGFVARRMNGVDWLRFFAVFDKKLKDSSLAARIYSRWAGRREPIPGVDDKWIERLETVKNYIESYFKPNA